MNTLIQLVIVLVNILMFAIFAEALLSWFPIDRNGPVPQALRTITEPVLDPLRRIIPAFGGIDLSPLIAILILFFISNALTKGGG